MKEKERAIFSELADKLSLPFVIVRCQAPVDELIKRIRKRQQSGSDASEATIDIIDKQKNWEEPLSQYELKRTLTIDTSDNCWHENLIKGIGSLL